MTSLTEFNVSGHGKVHWKSNDEPSNTIFNTIPIPPLPSGNPEMLRMDFIPVITNFFDFVEREAKPYIDMIHSFQKVKFTLECQHATPTV
uniref:Uncharacterized protein n=1 Tax=Panagrolaimus sp. JU765 TaxID=591449 RepID=A0AC34RSQ6_9BILA